MTKYLQTAPFSGGANSNAYRDGWEATFSKAAVPTAVPVSTPATASATGSRAVANMSDAEIIAEMQALCEEAAKPDAIFPPRWPAPLSFDDAKRVVLLFDAVKKPTQHIYMSSYGSCVQGKLVADNFRTTDWVVIVQQVRA